MSPTLSRENYFLTVINSLHEHQVKPGSLEHEQQNLILDLAQSVRLKQEITAGMLQRLNRLFERYQAVRLNVSLVSRTDLCSDEQRVLLRAEFIDGPDQLKRMYMEAIISLLEAMEGRRLDLQTCAHCERWFIPYQRAQVTRFCNAKCRNRHHYVNRLADRWEKIT